MDKIQFMRLWDLYGKLLTPTQQEITDMYFNLDLTVSEIAEQKGISRQGVSECLNLCKKQLKEYDDKLQHDRLLSEGDLLTSFMMTDVGIWAEKFVEAHPEYAADIAELSAILDKDYGKEIAAGLKKLGKE
ncbi:MAG: hypothetical protein K2O62_05255 [Clostridia bacterium]|nr:hypothetical protein [Clostridia bacterium]